MCWSDFTREAYFSFAYQLEIKSSSLPSVSQVPIRRIPRYASYANERFPLAVVVWIRIPASIKRVTASDVVLYATPSASAVLWMEKDKHYCCWFPETSRLLSFFPERNIDLPILRMYSEYDFRHRYLPSSHVRPDIPGCSADGPWRLFLLWTDF